MSVHQPGDFSLILAAPGDILGPQPVMETMLHAVEAWSQLWDPQGCLPGDFLKQVPSGVFSGAPL